MPRRLDFFVVAGLALLVRIGLVALSPGGFTGDYGYDASVYFTAADALTHGRMPYADFLLLHPPGMMLTLTPFAGLARLTGDHPAFIAASVLFSVVGAVNAGLIVRIASAWGLSRRASLVGGAFYAVWLSSAIPEVGARLEPMGTFVFLLGVLALTRGSARAAYLAGVAFGFAVTVKIWWVVPGLVLIVWYLVVARESRTWLRLSGGALAILVVVDLPFFVRAPNEMWRMVVTDQIGRHAAEDTKLERLYRLSAVNELGGRHSVKVAVVGLVLLVGLVVVLMAWRQRPARPLVVVAVVQALLLLISPTYFGYYSGFLASGLSLTLAASAEPSARRLGRALTVVPVLALATTVSVTAAVFTLTPKLAITKPLAVGPLPEQLRGVRCIVSDTPMALISLDALSRGLADGCPNWGDVSGRTYDVDFAQNSHISRRKNPRWQASLLRYLNSGDAFVIARYETGISKATLDELVRQPILAQYGTIAVRRSR